MSKGNGRRNINNMGNDMDKFNGTCNGISSKTISQDLSNDYTKHDMSNSNDNEKNNNLKSKYISRNKVFKNIIK